MDVRHGLFARMGVMRGELKVGASRQWGYGRVESWMQCKRGGE